MVGKPGQSIDQYILDKPIRDDGFSEIWHALAGPDLTLKEVTLKLFFRLEPGGSLFKRESKALSRLNPKFVFKPFDTGTFDNIDFLAFFPFQGSSLRERMQEAGGRLGLDDALPILCGILNALDHIHGKQVFHKDLKPENIFVISGDQVKLTDFSFAKIGWLPSDPVASGFDEPENVVFGTPLYMSPEQWRGEDAVDGRSDLYSFGVILHEVLTGESPVIRQGEMFRQEDPPSLIAAQPDLPPELEAVYLKLLSKNKEDRYQTAADAENALAGFLPRSPDWGLLNTAEVFGEENPDPERTKKVTSALGSQFLPPTATTLGADPVMRYSIETPGRSIGEGSEPTQVGFEGGAGVPIFPVGSFIANRYRVIEHVGRGGFANVYLVADTVGYIQEELAVKVPVVDLDPDLLVRKLQSQFKAWKVLSDTEPDFVVRLKNVERIEVEGSAAVAIFMEYMAGRSLSRMVMTKWNGHPRSREQLAQLMRLFLQACQAVRSLHAQGLLHRDIKPDNLLLDASQSRCKLSDFELVAVSADMDEVSRKQGTIPYMAPECFEGVYSVSSEIFSLGVTLYHLLSGALPFHLNLPQDRRYPPQNLSELNPIIVQELNQVVMRCLEADPNHRPQSIDDLIEDLVRLGLADEGANTAPVNLARLIIAHLSEEDIDFLIQSLERRGFRSDRADSVHQKADLIEEYCYTAPPHEVLAQNCTGRQLAALAGAMGLDPTVAVDREELIADILSAIGFRPGPRQIPGIETTRGYLDGQLIDLANATTSDECIGMVHSGLAAVERTIDLLVRFYGQMLYGSGLGSFLSRCANGKPSERLTFGEKIHALRLLCSEQPDIPLAHRIRQVFHWPIITRDVFKRLGELVADRNRLAHHTQFAGIHEAQRFGRQVLSAAVEVLTQLAENRAMPRVVQIISRQDDVYGRHFYVGRDDRGRSERIFTPLPLNVGQLYLFFPLTNPVRINPLIFPYDAAKRQA